MPIDPRIPVIDLFAGPGGLGEGFSACRSLRLAVSIEKEPFAHHTLTLRAFWRQFEGSPPPAYDAYLRGQITAAAMYTAHKPEAKAAKKEARRIELGTRSKAKVRRIVKSALEGHEDWVLIGGPPCQAYSVIGRSRRSTIEEYVPNLDVRQTLYVDYLQILADHAPSVFVMENVKGLLSATLDTRRMFGRIMEDLEAPAVAVRRERGSRPSRAPRYSVHALAATAGGAAAPTDYLVRSELYGVPQARHRVILLGVLEGATPPGRLMPSTGPFNVGAALAGLPRLRSGLTDIEDTNDLWLATIRSMTGQPWYEDVAVAVKRHMRAAAERAASPRQGRGAEYLPPNALYPATLNHAARGHIKADLERYFFASAFAQAHRRSPSLGDFPPGLLPDHKSALKALAGGHFADRFKVQVRHRPASTVTAHIAKDGHYYIHPDPTQCRSLTVREAARLQTFPDDYFFCGPRTAQYQQVGNAVPPVLARQIADIVAKLF